jgi:hypothetical protein
VKRKPTATDMKPQEEQSSIANRNKQEQTEEKPDTGASAGESEQHGNFRRWWSEYQKKVSSMLQAAPVKLQIQGKQ